MNISPLSQRLNALVDAARRMLERDGTYTTRGERVEYVHGYQVGVFGIQVKRSNPDAGARVAAFMAEVARKGYSHVGVWTERDTVHVDASIYFGYDQEALQAARHWNQVAVWDWSANTARYIDTNTETR